MAEKNDVIVPEDVQAKINRIWQMSLKELIDAESEIMELSDQTEDGMLPEELFGILQSAKMIMAGKIDRIATLVKDVIPIHRESVKNAAAAQIDKLNRTEQKLKQLTQEAIELRGGQKIDGDMWRARVQSSSSLDVVNPDLVPDYLKNVKVCIEFKFPATDSQMMEYWNQIIGYFKDNPDFKGTIGHDVPKTPIKEAMKTTPDIPGVSMVKNFHVRFEAGKVSPKKIKGTTKK